MSNLSLRARRRWRRAPARRFVPRLTVNGDRVTWTFKLSPFITVRDHRAGWELTYRADAGRRLGVLLGARRIWS